MASMGLSNVWQRLKDQKIPSTHRPGDVATIDNSLHSSKIIQIYRANYFLNVIPKGLYGNIIKVSLYWNTLELCCYTRTVKHTSKLGHGQVGKYVLVWPREQVACQGPRLLTRFKWDWWHWWVIICIIKVVCCFPPINAPTVTAF